MTMTELSRRGRAAYWVVAAFAWAGVAATLIITAFDGYAAPTWSGLVLWTGCFEGCWLLLVVLCPLACVLVG